MKELVAGDADNGRGLVRFLCAGFPVLTPGMVYKALRRKDIRVNGRRISADMPLAAGDVVAVYLPDGDLEAAQADTPSLSVVIPVVYQDRDLLIVDKPQGLAVHSGASVQDGTLVDLLRERFGDRRLSLCHRIDLNTGGLVVLAFGQDAVSAVADIMKQGLLAKRYRCLVRGLWDAHDAGPDGFSTREAWLEKPRSGGRVYIHDQAVPDAQPVSTRIRLLHVYKGAGPDGEPISELEVELGTGRTHQIRVHLAYLGHQVIGDGLYGRNTYNRFFRNTDGSRVTRQQLFATRLEFGWLDKNHRLAQMSNRRFEVAPHYSMVISGQ